MFAENHLDERLENEFIPKSKQCRFKANSYRVSLASFYRAVYFLDDSNSNDPVAVWYWIGSHEDYNNMRG